MKTNVCKSLVCTTMLIGLVSAAGELRAGSIDYTDWDNYLLPPEKLGPAINRSYVEAGAEISADGKSLFFRSDRPGGSGEDDIWMATRLSVSDPWEPAANLGATVNSPSNDRSMTISTDGRLLIFSSDRPGGFGNADLWMTTRNSVFDPWGPPVNLGPDVNTASMDSAPEISADGESLFLLSDRSGGLGSFDIWMTTWDSVSDSWETPVNVGAPINSSSLELHPEISPDGRWLFFASNRPVATGFPGVFVSHRVTVSDAWEPPVNLPINTAAGEAGPSLSADGSTLYYHSPFPFGSSDIWQVTIVPEPSTLALGAIAAAALLAVGRWRRKWTV